MLITLSRCTAIWQLVAEVLLTGLVSHKLMFLIFWTFHYFIYNNSTKTSTDLHITFKIFCNKFIFFTSYNFSLFNAALDFTFQILLYSTDNSFALRELHKFMVSLVPETTPLIYVVSKPLLLKQVRN